MAVRDGAPPAPVSSAPVVSGFPAAIARAGLGAVDGGGGSSTITFPGPDGVPPYVPFSTEPVTVSRFGLGDIQSAATSYAQDQVGQARAAATEYAQDAVGDARSALTERAGSAIDAASNAAKGALGGAAGGGAGDADKAFEDLYDRLKRELMIEQEQLGQLFHEP